MEQTLFVILIAMALKISNAIITQIFCSKHQMNIRNKQKTESFLFTLAKLFVKAFNVIQVGVIRVDG